MRFFSILAVIFAVGFGVSTSGSETAEGLKKDIASFKKEASLKLDELDRKIAQLKAESKVAAAHELEEARDKLRKSIEETQQTSQSKWSELKLAFARSLEVLHAKAQKVLKE